MAKQRIICPQCRVKYKVESASIPEGGVIVKCPQCRHRFYVKKSTSPEQKIPLAGRTEINDRPVDTGSIVCPQCGFAQPVSGNCLNCGINFKNYYLLQSIIETDRDEPGYAGSVQPPSPADPSPSSQRKSYRFSKKKIGLAVLVLLLIAAPSFFLLARHFENSAYRKALTAGTIDEYEFFLKRYPKSDKVGEIEELHQELLFQEADRTGSVEGFEKYLQLYPDGLHRDRAEKKVEALSFENARKEGSMDKLDEYIEKYPKGLFVREARESIRLIKLKKDDARNFARAKNEKTVDAFVSYLDSFPNGDHRESIKSLLVKQATEEIIRECNTRSDWRKLISILESVQNYAPDVFPDLVKLVTIKPIAIIDRSAEDSVKVSDFEQMLYRAGLFFPCPPHIGIQKYSLTLYNHQEQYNSKDYYLDGLFTCSLSCAETIISATLLYPGGNIAFNIESKGKRCPESGMRFQLPSGTIGGQACQAAQDQLKTEAFSAAWNEFNKNFMTRAMKHLR